MRKLQPNIVIWNDNGDRADLRWVGTEGGSVGETNWSLLNATGDVPYDMLHFGVENGNAWVPGEVNTSIRPEWFYHPAEDKKVKTVPQLMETYYNSIGHNGTLLLNFPIMPNGLINGIDSAAAINFGKQVKAAFAVNLAQNKPAMASNVRGSSKVFGADKAVDNNDNTYWATDDSVTTATLTVNMGNPTRVNRFLAQEYIRLGQRVKAFKVEAFVDGTWKEVAAGTTIGYKRIVSFADVVAQKIRLVITASKSSIVINNVGVYYAPQLLTPPAIYRNQQGEISITPADKQSVVFYTTDGSMPTTKSTKYVQPFATEGKPEIRAIAYDAVSQKSSTESREKFDIARSKWKITGISDDKASVVLDGNPNTTWHQGHDKKLPADLVIDLGAEETIVGFRYLPDQSAWGPGIIAGYQFAVSQNNTDWKVVSSGEFANIKNNPLWQSVHFAPEKARYIKLTALKNTDATNEIGYAEVDIITQ